ncbi:ABC transporter permease [Clostridium gelidum]|uniref:ABC transporter permease n=1 Tax=Clostridium gelidum TaxID=704125 RepID=A0ABM7TDM1_9CLOT|nr:ABC transporter permease [Clostridium gelidum]BCZ49232.1 ABC transporter permease [Clostridium gelidum]
MFNIIYSEFIKLRKSFIFIIALIGGVLMPGVQFVGAIGTVAEHYNEIQQVSIEPFLKSYIGNIEVMSFQFTYIIIFSLIAAYIFSREFTDKTSNILYTYPISKIKIFIGKFITIYILILFVYIIQFITTYLSLYIAWGELPSAEFISNDMKVNLYSVLLQFLLIPIPVLIANITKNIIFPIVYGVLGAVIEMLLMGITIKGSIYGQFCPLLLPSLPFYHYHMGDPIDFVITSGSAVITFGVFMFLCIYHCSNADIN